MPRWEECSRAKIGCEGWEESSEGSLEEFAARPDGGFKATGPAEAEGDGDVWCAATVTAAAPAGMAGAANFTGDADDVGASEGVNRTSGAAVAPENERTWADVGGFDLDGTCIVGGDQGEADREELADGGTKTTGAEMTDTEVPISEVAPRLIPGRQYVGLVDGRWQVRWGGGSSGATTVEAGGGVGDARTGLGDADIDGSSLATGVEFSCPRGPANAQDVLGRVWWVHWGPLSRSGPTGSAHAGRGPRSIAPKVPPGGGIWRAALLLAAASRPVKAGWRFGGGAWGWDRPLATHPTIIYPQIAFGAAIACPRSRLAGHAGCHARCVSLFFSTSLFCSRTRNRVDLSHVAKNAFGNQMGPNVQKAMPAGSPAHQGLTNCGLSQKIFFFGPF